MLVEDSEHVKQSSNFYLFMYLFMYLFILFAFLWNFLLNLTEFGASALSCWGYKISVSVFNPLKYVLIVAFLLFWLLSFTCPSFVAVV